MWILLNLNHGSCHCHAATVTENQVVADAEKTEEEPETQEDDWLKKLADFAK